MPLEPWTYARILQLIDETVEESLHLDYKAAGALAKVPQKKDEIVKDVTAFANSDGGMIIYGVREHTDMERRHLPAAIDPIHRRDFSKEWLEQVISNAAPRVPGILIHPVPVPGDETRCLYVVDIPKGETAHQAADCKYYRRFNFESVPMRDHEVRDVMNRIKVPRIEVQAYLGLRNPWEESSFLLKLTNVSARLAEHFHVVVRLPPQVEGRLISPKGEQLTMDRDENGDSYFGFSLGQSLHKTPLFPASTVTLDQELRADVNRFEMKDGRPLSPRPTIGVKVYADEMQPLHLEFDPSEVCGAWAAPLDPLKVHGEVNNGREVEG